jgi:1-acyl-sn-glycerol-3-phosphate acyltransferase
MRLWGPLRRRRAWREHGISEIDIRGGEHLRRAVAEGYGTLIAPNHPTHADPFVLTEVADRLKSPFYYMTAWQVFARTHALGRRVLRHHGCFSINREGHDLRAYRQAVKILEGSRPLVIFPEGEVFHLNDRTAPFRRGAATAALRAARRSNRPVVCIPCGLKYRYVDDPTPQMERVLRQLERKLALQSTPEASLARRLLRLADEVLGTKEIELLSYRRHGSTQERTNFLIDTLLGRLERKHDVVRPSATVPERVKELRRRAIAEGDDAFGGAADAQRDLDELFLVMQLYSYPVDYLAGRPSRERLVETVDKLEEDLLQVATCGLRGTRRVSVTFGEPILAPPDGRRDAAELTDELRRRVQELLDAENGVQLVSSPPRGLPEGRPATTRASAA